MIIKNLFKKINELTYFQIEMEVSFNTSFIAQRGHRDGSISGEVVDFPIIDEGYIKIKPRYWFEIYSFCKADQANRSFLAFIKEGKNLKIERLVNEQLNYKGVRLNFGSVGHTLPNEEEFKKFFKRVIEEGELQEFQYDI